jgi:hypothetical protein
MEPLFTILSLLQTETHFHFVVTIFILAILIGFYRYYSVFLKAKFPILGKTLLQRNFESHTSQINYKTYTIAIAMSLLLFIIYLLTSPSIYKEKPSGDAVYFTMMTVYADMPSELNIPITSLHGNRILVPILVHALVGRELKQAIHEYEKLSHRKLTADIFYFWLRDGGDENLATIQAEQGIDSKARLSKINEDEKVLLSKINKLVWKGFTIVNLIAFIVQIIFVLAILAYLRIPSLVALLICFIYSTSFVNVRLYVFWPYMTDPLALSFLLAGWYFMLEKKHILFTSLLILGVLVKEQLLLLLVAFFFYNLLNTDDAPPNIKMMLARLPIIVFWSIIPVIVYLWLRMYPYFAIQGNVLPVMEHYTNYVMYNVDKPYDFSKIFSDYIYLFQYHFNKLFSVEGVFKSLLIPINVFGVLFFLLLKRIKNVINIIYQNNNIYMLFYILPYLLLGLFMVDRYIFYIVPVILILSAFIISDLSSKHSLFFFLVLLLINLLMMRFFSQIHPRWLQTEYFNILMIALSLVLNRLAWIFFSMSFALEKKLQ